MILYKNMKTMFHSPVGYTDFFNTATGVLQRDALVPCMFI